MALYYDLPVYRDTYRLILKIFECTKDFSKEYKDAGPDWAIERQISLEVQFDQSVKG